MIPHPLTLLYCWLLGLGAESAAGAVFGWLGEVLFDLFRWGWLGDAAYSWLLRGLGWAAVLAGAAFVGFFMRLLAERSWRRAAAWAFGAQVLLGAAAALLSGGRAGALPGPVAFVLSAAGCAAGARLCDRERRRSGVEAAEELLRGWMFWERGGAR